MPIRQEFVFVPPEGTEFVDINIWAQRLPESERQEWLLAVERQLQLRQRSIDQGQLTVDTTNSERNCYIWDEHTVKNSRPMEYKPYDDIWLKYWNRYLQETGIKFEVKETEC